ncbi:Enolase, C-terminal TIM barrel domain-containing protein [Pseudoneurospora amorphoporcata]|uniref:Enolase n=1 Tax=Pseudoneurospora amorphoporcata TaxID=241081 RepID=A0AAN6SFC6_9PEZI|nr:Enolase, C-terminal TIM barrel domain-containing protein [Pseudoneurospora amorphoporcata]
MILDVKAAQRLDSRGNPTVQVALKTAHGTFRALVPSGTSTGVHEAVELRDNDQRKYGGKGVLTAVNNVNEIIGPALIKEGYDPHRDLKQIDGFMRELDGTPNKAKLGANAILGVSMACARAGAAAANIPLYEFLRRESGEESPYVMPVPFFNVLNGGKHSSNGMAFREFMIAPTGAKTIEEGIRMASETYHVLKQIIADKFGVIYTCIGDEGGFAPPITQPEEALDLLTEAVAKAGYTDKIKFGIDPASASKPSVLEEAEGAPNAHWDADDIRTPNQMMDLYNSLIEKYPIPLLEDSFAEDDWESWTTFCADCKEELVGDDLLCTNVERLRMAESRRACNAMLLKVNQIGTVTEAIDAAKLAKSLDWGVFVSHRSGETTDDFIADLAVGLGTGHIKSGAPCRGERVAKYNRLMDIEAELKESWKPWSYAGEQFRKPEAFFI